MCISCCTNIVQCRAWNKEKGGGSRSHDFRLLLRQHVEISLSRNTGPSASKSSQIKEEMSPSFVQSCKRDLSQNPDEDWEKGIQTFSWRFSSPSLSSLWWLLATYKPSESPKPPATQHFWGQAEKARGKSLERALQCLESAEALATVSCAQLWSKSLKWAYSLQKCGCARGGEGNKTEKRHFIEHCGGHEGASKGKIHTGGLNGAWNGLTPPVSLLRVFCVISPTPWRFCSRCKRPGPSLQGPWWSAW